MVKNLNKSTSVQTSLSEIAYEKVKEMILSFEIPPGAPLVELQMIKKLGMSRTPLREAFRRLEQEGFINLIPRKGWFVAEISLRDIQEIFVVREGLEGITARLAATSMPDEMLTELNEYMNNLNINRSNSKNLDPGDKIHDYILKAVDNKRITNVIALYDSHMRRFHNIATRLPGRIEQSYREHMEILHALNARDGDLAEHNMREHIQSTKKSIFTAIAEGEKWW